MVNINKNIIAVAIAFDAVVITCDTISVGSPGVFSEVLVNEGNGYVENDLT